MNKIITFGLWGTSRMYLDGALANIECAAKYYPGWLCKFYVAENCPLSPILQKKSLQGLCEVVIMPPLEEVPGSTTNISEHHNPIHKAMTWRFRAFYEPDNEIVISRDCDSRVNPREAAAVQEWLDTGLLGHIMYDNEHHHNGGLMGGMIGLRTYPFQKPTLEEAHASWLHDISIFDKWYQTEGYRHGLRNVHFDIHVAREIYFNRLKGYIYRTGFGTENPHKVDMPPELGTHLGETINPELRYEVYE